jgi:DNA polymerase I-like protein with 3'-5' exonuclease and polymerase domains
MAWDLVRFLCSLDKNYIGQNFMYDMNFLWTRYGIPVPGAADDTMLMHHAMQPEMEKSLAFLGTIYTDEPQWKFMRSHSKTRKKED